MIALPQISDLTDEEINTIIAEACGWRFNEHWANPPGTTSWIPLDDFEQLHCAGLPRYTTSLDAMREAESKISDSFGYIGSIAYENILKELGPNKPAFATAIQRARALVIAIGRATV